MMKKLLAAAIAIGALLTVVTAASADHSWNGYHWPSDNLEPTVVDRTTSPLYDVSAGVLEWSGLDTPIQPALLTDAKKGDIAVTEGFSQSWLGLARIFIDEGGHITKGEVKLNTRLLNSYGPVAADHVLCQEIGHVLGLDHNRDGDTCMNDQVLGFPAPNQHDTDTLNAVYNHADDSGGGDDGGNGGGGGPPCDKNPDHPRCQSGNGVWITVHVFRAP